MARSAKRKAARNLNRGSRPIFEFTKLPLDLQFLVLCNCDLTGIATLTKAIPSLKNLWLRYSGTAIQSALEEIPLPLATLLYVTSTLESDSDGRFDARDMVDILNREMLTKRETGRSQLFTVKEVALRMQSLVSIYAEVKVAADIVAQAMGAAMQVSLDRLIVVAPIALSDTEQTRKMCALLVVRIYYQLRFKRKRNVAAAFLKTLTPWQMVQGSSIEEFVDSCVKEPCKLLDKMIDKRYTCRESLSQKSLFLRDYIQATVADIEMGYNSGHRCQIPRYSDAVKTELIRRRRWSEQPNRRQLSGPRFSPIHRREGEYPVWHPVWHSAGQLRSDGWVMCPNLYGYMRTQRVVFRCGILFWDQDRLKDWDVTQWTDIEELAHWAANLYARYPGSLQKDYEEETRSRQIVEWTRSHVQITFEEFLAKQEGEDKGQ